MIRERNKGYQITRAHWTKTRGYAVPSLVLVFVIGGVFWCTVSALILFTAWSERPLQALGSGSNHGGWREPALKRE